MSNETFRVKLVSEAAEYVSITPIIHRDYTLHELIGAMLPVVGRDAERIRQMLRVGGLSNGEYRFRWEGREVDAAQIEGVLAGYPRAEPQRPFEAEKCVAIRFSRGVEVLSLPRESAERKSLFAAKSFWDEFLRFARSGLRYADYAYADQADVYVLELDLSSHEAFRALLPLMKPKSAGDRLERLRPEKIELLTRR